MGTLVKTQSKIDTTVQTQRYKHRDTNTGQRHPVTDMDTTGADAEPDI
jgi:hypothetical protein